MSTALNPWVSTELAPDDRAKGLFDEIVDLIKKCWEEDEDDFRALKTSTDNDDAVLGTVTIDKHVLSYLLKKAAAPGSLVAGADVKAINRRVEQAAKHVGVARKQIAARKAEYLAIQASEPAGESDESSPNSRREGTNGSTDPAPDSA